MTCLAAISYTWAWVAFMLNTWSKLNLWTSVLVPLSVVTDIPVFPAKSTHRSLS